MKIKDGAIELFGPYNIEKVLKKLYDDGWKVESYLPYIIEVVKYEMPVDDPFTHIQEDREVLSIALKLTRKRTEETLKVFFK